MNRFFDCHEEELAVACLAMARRFHRAGRIFTFGEGCGVTDAEHVAVEFLHPVVAGKRALPAVALKGDVAGQLETLASVDDIAIAFVETAGEAMMGAVQSARRLGMLAVIFSGKQGMAADHSFTVDCDDSLIRQEVHEVAYHVLWELVHVFFGHRGILEEA
ncbi:MAG: phosphoheptose isomerase [Armatimonadetes bacterium]|nr:phosphoheptose isomerase [Armatimonadota bacterium]